jgi:hypothetical protein
MSRPRPHDSMSRPSSACFDAYEGRCWGHLHYTPRRKCSRSPTGDGLARRRQGQNAAGGRCHAGTTHPHDGWETARRDVPRTRSGPGDVIMRPEISPPRMGCKHRLNVRRGEIVVCMDCWAQVIVPGRGTLRDLPVASGSIVVRGTPGGFALRPGPGSWVSGMFPWDRKAEAHSLSSKNLTLISYKYRGPFPMRSAARWLNTGRPALVRAPSLKQTS